jgi:putative heme-binding domain-containing protein
VHAMRIITEKVNTAPLYPVVLSALDDTDPHVQRAAVEAIAKHPDMKTLEALLAHQQKIPDYDSHHLYTTRLWLRNILRNENLLQQAVAREWKNTDAAVLADVMTGVNAADAGLFLFEYSQNQEVAENKLPQVWQHMTRFIPAAYIGEAIILAKKKSAGNTDAEFVLFTAIEQGLAQRGAKETDELKKWGSELGQVLLEQHFPENAVANAGDLMEKLPTNVVAKQKFAVEIAGKYQLVPLEPHVKASLQASATDNTVKVAAAKALLQLSPETNTGPVEKILQDESQPVELRRQLIGILGEFPGAATRKVLEKVNNVPPALQRELVMALAGSPEGKSIIFRKVKNGEIFPRILMEPTSEERILLKISDAQRSAYKELIASLPPVSEEKNKLIADRLVKFTRADSLIDTGHTVFIQNCAPCHKVGNEGGMIGPQLTGIGNWGANALTEKIMDPNRNISEAFRNYTITLKDGKVITGLYRRDEGEILVFADATGQEMQVPKKDIVERKASKYTLMPDNFGDRLSLQDYNALLSYLLSLK